MMPSVLHRRQSCLRRIQRMNINCLEKMLQCCLSLLYDQSRAAAVLAVSSICPLCFAFTGDRRAGRERPESVWQAGQRWGIRQRCCRYPRRGNVTQHTSLLVFTALFIQQSGNNINHFLQMCSPAELRQQSEELYAVIDEILADSSIPEVS